MDMIVNEPTVSSSIFFGTNGAIRLLINLVRALMCFTKGISTLPKATGSQTLVDEAEAGVLLKQLQQATDTGEQAEFGYIKLLARCNMPRQSQVSMHEHLCLLYSSKQE